jgi:hypothetical protein
MNILKVGDMFLNMDNVTCVQTDLCGCVHVNFVDGNERVLRGSDALRITEYMRRNATFIEFAEDL